MEEEKTLCVCCKKEIKDKQYYEIDFKDLCETHIFCKDCFRDIYAEATGWNLVVF